VTKTRSATATHPEESRTTDGIAPSSEGVSQTAHHLPEYLRNIGFMAQTPKSLQAKVEYYLAKSTEVRDISKRIRKESEASRIRRQQASEVIVSNPPTPNARPKSANRIS
jgi:hypothetical protein